MCVEFAFCVQGNQNAKHIVGKTRFTFHLKSHICFGKLNINNIHYPLNPSNSSVHVAQVNYFSHFNIQSNKLGSNLNIKSVNYFKCQTSSKSATPVNIYLFKVNNRNNRKRCVICSKLKITSTSITFSCCL